MFREGLFKIDEEAEKAAKRYSIIHWKTGEPKESGSYIITTDEGTVAIASFYNDYSSDIEFFKICVTAWCKLSDIKPCKEE